MMSNTKTRAGEEKTYIFAENQNTWVSYYPEDIVFHLTERFDDYPNRRWYEKGIYYDYDLIYYHNSRFNKSAIIMSFWEITGKVMSCPDCAMTKLWYVKDFERTDERKVSLEELKAALLEMKNHIPVKVFTKFVETLDKDHDFKLYANEEVKEL